MLPFIIGGIALTITGYKLKKYLDDDDNYTKFEEAFIDGYEWLDKIENYVNDSLDSLIPKDEEFQPDEMRTTTDLKKDE